MPLSLHADTLAALGDSNIQIAFLLRLGFSTGDIYLSTTSADLSYGGNTYLGNGWLRWLSEIPKSEVLQANAATFTLSGLPASVLSKLFNGSQHNQTCDLYFALLENEESRENLVNYSQDLSQLTSSNATIETNVATAPDGTHTADRLKEDSATGDHQAYSQTALSIATEYIFSWCFKDEASDRNLRFVLNANGFSANQIIIIDPSDGSIVSTNFSSEVSSYSVDAVANGFYKLTIRARTSANPTSQEFQAALIEKPSTSSYAGNGNASVLLWGQQIRQIPGRSSGYIATAGSAANYVGNAEAIIGDPIYLFGGELDTAELDEGSDDSTVKIKFIDTVLDVTRPVARRFTHEDQIAEYPGDKGFEYVKSIATYKGWWGRGVSPRGR